MNVITNFMCLADRKPARSRFLIPRSRHRERMRYDTEDLDVGDAYHANDAACRQAVQYKNAIALAHLQGA